MATKAELEKELAELRRQLDERSEPEAGASGTGPNGSLRSGVSLLSERRPG